MKRLIATAICAVTPTFAAANLPLDCVKAITLNKQDEVKRLAAEIITEGKDYSSIERNNASECLEAATGVYHRYDPEAGAFVPDEAAGEAQKAEDERKRAEWEREREQRKREAADKAREAAIAAGDEQALLEKLREEADAAKLQRELNVYDRLVDGCKNMYRRSPDETITNQLCFEVFMKRGLPDS